MATMVGTEKDLPSLLKDLITLDYDAIEAYDAAIDRLKDGRLRDSLLLFRDDHQRHTVDLSLVLREYGGTPPDGADLKQVLTKGKVVLASLVGDKAILIAMKTNEDDTNTAYERAVHHTGVPEDLRALLERNLADERRHRAWMEQRIASFDKAEQGTAQL